MQTFKQYLKESTNNIRPTNSMNPKDIYGVDYDPFDNKGYSELISPVTKRAYGDKNDPTYLASIKNINNINSIEEIKKVYKELMDQYNILNQGIKDYPILGFYLETPQVEFKRRNMIGQKLVKLEKVAKMAGFNLD